MIEKCNNCRWSVNDKCLNSAVDEIKEDCKHFYSYDEMENLSNNDECTGVLEC